MASLSLVEVKIPNGDVLATIGGDGETFPNVRGKRLVAVVMPDNWTTADLSLVAKAVSQDAVEEPVYRAGVLYVIPAAATRYITLSDVPVDFNFVTVYSGTYSAPVTQGGDRIIGLVLLG